MTARILRRRALAEAPGAVLHGELARRLPCCGAPTSPAATDTSEVSKCGKLSTATWPPDASRTAAGAGCAEQVTRVKPARSQHHREPTRRLPDQRLNPLLDAIAEMLVARNLKTLVSRRCAVAWKPIAQWVTRRRDDESCHVRAPIYGRSARRARQISRPAGRSRPADTPRARDGPWPTNTRVGARSSRGPGGTPGNRQPTPITANDRHSNRRNAHTASPG